MSEGAMRHTPGPWEAGKYSGRDTVFDSRGNGTVAIATVHDTPIEPSDANARLIAAAPLLLEACKAAEKRLERMVQLAEWEDEDRSDFEALELLRSAIGAGKGEK